MELVTVGGGLEHVPGDARSTWGAEQDLLHLGPAGGGGACTLGARRAELDTLAAAAHARRAALERAARELLALQASDWAFMTTRGSAPSDYPLRAHGGGARGSRRRPRALTDSPRRAGAVLRGLAPDLDLAPLST